MAKMHILLLEYIWISYNYFKTYINSFFVLYLSVMAERFQDCTEYEQKMFLCAYNTITRMEKWDFLKNYEPPELSGFMFDRNATVNEIMSQIAEDYNYGHSGSSMAFTMRKMQEIAKTK